MQIIRRTRLGNDTEDITNVPLSARVGNIAILDGYEVLSATLTGTPPGPILQGAEAGGQAAKPAPGPATRPLPRLFDVLKLEINASPRGIAYVDSKNMFVFNDPTQTDKLFLADNRGEPQKVITIQYPTDDPIQAVEGLAYIPATAPQFSGTLVMAATFLNANSDIESRIEVIDLSGAVLREIVPQGDLAEIFLTGVTYKAPASLLVSSDDDETIYELDFDGTQIGVYTPPPTSPQLLHGIEGLAQTPDGKTIAVGGFDGFLASVDLSNDKPPRALVDYRIGLGLSLPSGLAWDSSANRFLILSFDRQRPEGQFISSVAPTLDSFATAVTVDVQTRKVAFLPDELLIAATHANNPRGILLFKKGQPAGQIDTAPFGTPIVISFIPQTNEFVLVFRDADATKRRKLFVLTRAGTLSRIIDLGPVGVTRISAVASFNPKHPSGGQFLVIDSTENIGVVTDFAGTKLSQFSVRDTLGLLTPTGVSAITSGPDAGAFAISNGENSEIVVFRLD